MDSLLVLLAALPQPFTRAEVASAGMPDRVVRKMLEAGLIICLAKGLYAVREPWLAASSWHRHHEKSLAAARLTPDAIVSHASGASTLELPHPAYASKKVAMTLLDDTRTSRHDTWRRFHRGRTPPEHIVIRHGLPGLIPARIVIDSGREVPQRDALAIADGALRAAMTTRAELLDMRLHQRHWPGVASTNDLVLLADGRRENWLESASASAIWRWGLPIGVPQVNVFTPDGGFLGRPDLLWPAHGVVGEADGTQKYLIKGATDEAVREALISEKVREAGMTSVGLEFVRWTMSEAIGGDAIHTRFMKAADPARAARVQAVFRCSCCNFPLEECLVEAELVAWRLKVSRGFERKIW